MSFFKTNDAGCMADEFLQKAETVTVEKKADNKADNCGSLASF